MIDQLIESTVSIKKTKIDPDQKMAAKALLLAHFPQMLNAGQLIIHFGPGRTPFFVELQERQDIVRQELQQAS